MEMLEKLWTTPILIYYPSYIITITLKFIRLFFQKEVYTSAIKFIFSILHRKIKILFAISKACKVKLKRTIYRNLQFAKILQHY